MHKLISKTIFIILILSVFLISTPIHYLIAQEFGYDLNFHPEPLNSINPAMITLINASFNYNKNIKNSNKIDKIGLNILPEAEIKSKSIEIKKILITAYSSTPDQTDSTPFITASGSKVYFGTAATNCLLFETRIRIPEIFSDQIFIIKDRMHNRFKCRIDIWFPTRQEAIDFGVQWSEVYIY